MDVIEFDSLAEYTFAVDKERRTIRGVVVPWGGIGRHRDGRKWRFARGSLRYVDAKYVRFNADHDPGQGLGRAVESEDTDAGLVMAFRVSPGPAGDRALADAAARRKTGLSVEVDIDTADTAEDPNEAGVLLVNMANLTGVGHVERPAFNDSRIISVAASEDGKDTGMPENDTTTVVEEETAAPAPAGPVTLTAEQFSQLLTRHPETVPAVRPTVDPTRQVQRAQVNEPLPYRFGFEGGRTVFRRDAEFDFSSDVMAVLQAARDKTDYSAPLARVNGMIQAAFADLETADVTALNPNRHRPDMWVPQADLPTPLWDMVNSGSTDGTKFDIPKFTSSSALVGAATEKTEPAGGAYVAELQTITPTQVWGKIEITRQAWRAGGSPQLSGILWDQMQREYYEDREDAVATFLATLTAAADIALTGTPASTPDNDDDQVTVNDLEMAIADLQFARGGRAISAFAVHQALFRVLARVKDDAGRPMYPLLSPMNANGTSQSRFQYIDIAGVRAVGARSLGTPSTASTNSWMFDPSRVRGWASAPERLFWDFGATVQTANIPQLSFVTLGIYGDVAFGNTDIGGVRQVTFDPSV